MRKTGLLNDQIGGVSSRVKVEPVHGKHYRFLPNPEDSFSRAYRTVLTPSDFDCILSLIQKGRVEVAVDTRTRGIELIPDSQTEAYLDSVFNALMDEAAFEANAV